jgi:RimJ/RimL family protein N-acetyltransferase
MNTMCALALVHSRLTRPRTAKWRNAAAMCCPRACLTWWQRRQVSYSVYIAPEAQGQGLGRALLAELAARAEQAGVRKLIAVIGDSANAGSIALHQSAGFSHVGVLQSCGWKFDQWLDVVLMDKSLGRGDTCRPEPTN